MEKKTKTDITEPESNSQPESKQVKGVYSETFRGLLKNPLNVFWNPQEERVRSIVRIILFILVMLLATMGVTLIVTIIAQGLLSGQDLTAKTIPPNVFTIEMFLQALMYVAPVAITLWVMSRYFDKRSITDFGIRFRKQWWLDLLFGLLLGAVLMAIIFGVEKAFGWIHIVALNANTIYPIPFALGIGAEVLLFIAVAIFEEAIVRGYLLRNIAEGLQWGKFGRSMAVLISFVLTAVVFGFLHNSNPNITWLAIVNLGIAGLFLGFGYIMTGDLAIPIGFHITWNIFQGVLFGFPVSGLTASVSSMRTFQTGPALLTGGDFGPEGGLIVILVFILGTALIWYYLKLTRKTVKIDESIAVYTPRVFPTKEEPTRNSVKMTASKKEE